MAIKALLRSLIHKKDITGLFSAFTVLDLTTGVAINWLITLTFKKGSELGGIWTGSPFFCAAILLMTVVLMVFLVKSQLPENHLSSDTSITSVESSASSIVHIDASTVVPNPC
jgi:hypothetical protein